jgi:hypothetical protein
VAKGNESNVVKFSAEKESQKTSIVYQNAVMVDLIRGVMPSWEKGIKYRAKGVLSKEDKASSLILRLRKSIRDSTKRIRK